MTKSKQIVIRISNEQHHFIKEMDGSFSQIWQVGFDIWSHDFPEFLQKKAKEYEKSYKQCIYKMQKCINNVYTKNKKLDELIKQYIDSGRSLDNPTSLDKSWVKGRVAKLSGINVDRFFMYATDRFNNETQQLLKGIE